MGTWIHDLENAMLIGQSIVPVSKAADFLGSAIDCLKAEHGLAVIGEVGAVTGTSPTLDWQIWESEASAGTYTQITPDTTAVQVTASNSVQVLRFKRTKRYIKAKAVIAGTNPAFLISALVVGQKKTV